MATGRSGLIIAFWRWSDELQGPRNAPLLPNKVCAAMRAGASFHAKSGACECDAVLSGGLLAAVGSRQVRLAPRSLRAGCSNSD